MIDELREENQISDEKIQADEKSNGYMKIFILQIIFVGIIVAAVLIIKITDGDLFLKVKNFYIDNFCDDTSVSEVLNDKKEEVAPVITAEKISFTKKHEKAIGLSSVNSMIIPLVGTVTSHFGGRQNPLFGGDEVHKGVDIAGKTGDSIVCALSGVVTLVRDSPSYGKYLIVNHGNFSTLYAHCSEILKNSGETAEKGEVVALVGETGQATAPHLHFEIMFGENRVDPEWWLTW